MKRLVIVALLVACKASSQNAIDAAISDSSGDDVGPDGAAHAIKTVFVIPMENKANSAIYGNTTDAPYINGLLTTMAAHATKFGDELPALPSEPHYVWMEAGTNALGDKTFTTDADSSAGNSTNNTQHLVAQLMTAGISWTSYQEGITSGTCPISSTGDYAAKHDPFVFFQDIVGSPPSKSAPICASHHKSYADFPADLAAGLTGYIYITPDLCHDMHGAADCPSGTTDPSNIQAGDTWLSTELPRIVDYANAHDGVVLITWDEGDSSNLIPLLALGSHVKVNTTSATVYTHSSIIKSVDELLGAPVLPSVASANDFADMFDAGTF
ncbi:MAG TPA: alkaline phosphatase family protein [Kofleriaceae bacterium]|jgi:hypothetical protein|nr:alkaline phosphatase family protein [Kofleriaceae bacterium]